MKINQSDNSLYSAKKRGNKVQNQSARKIPTVNFFNHTITKQNPRVQARKKRSTDSSKESMCNVMERTSLTLEWMTNSFDVATSAFSSLNFFGIPIGSIPSSFSAAGSISLYSAKYLTDMGYIVQGCSDIPFDDLKRFFGEKLDQVNKKLDKNYSAIKDILEEIHRNYQAIKRVEEKVDRNLITVQSGFTHVNQQLVKIDHKITAGFEKNRIFLIEKFTSNLIIFIERFYSEINALKYFSPEEVIVKLKKEGILEYLKNARTDYSETSLHSILNNIINQQLAIPRSAHDESAFIALDLLCLGVETYYSALSFLLQGYVLLAEDSYQKNELEVYNQYFSLVLITLHDFTTSLNGAYGKENGLINKVIHVLNTLNALSFVKNKKNDMGKFYSEKIVKLNQIKTQLININNLPHYKPSEQIRCNFTGSIMETPFLGWKSNRRVSYAIQYRKKGFYSQVSDWSIPYTLSNKAFPNLDIGISPEGTTRFIFRKFDSDRPELVGIVEDRNKIEFKDMHRDFYNLFLEANQEVVNKNKERFTHRIAYNLNVTAIFEKGRQAIHVAAQTGNLLAVIDLMKKGAGINAQDEAGYTPLHLAAKLGYENFTQELIDLGANVNLATNSNWTALHLAAQEGHIETVNSLLHAKGIDINAKTADGFTPLHVAVSSNKNDAVISKLSSDPRTLVNMLSKGSLTSLHLAVLGGDESVVSILLNHNNIDINLASERGMTALHLAVFTRNKKILEQMLKHENINVNVCSNEG